MAAAADPLSVAPEHSRAYRLRRFVNWFPLGVTYACFYMGRYNFNVVKGHMGDLFGMNKVQMGLIATAGFWTYAASVMLNGPLTDRFGGKRAMLVGAAGTAAVNLAVGLLFLGGWHGGILPGMMLLWALNHYFLSFGACSVVKVNAPWFHVRERGVFGGIFGGMISSGYFLALGVGGLIFRALPWYWVFLVPAALAAAMFVIVSAVVRNSPAEAGHRDFDTGDASSGDDERVDLGYLLRTILRNPVIVTIAAAEFCTGFVRQGLLLYFPEFLKEVHHVGPGTHLFEWASTGVTLGGIVGGLLCGWLSDRLFSSRRPPVAFLFYLCQIGSLMALGQVHSATLAAFLVGFSCTWIFGVHGMLSGTASMDFGGRKAAATAAGLLDGVQYLASGLTGFGLGWLVQTYGWGVWTWAIVPFSLAGALLMTRVWNARPQRSAPRRLEADAGPRPAAA